VTTTRRYVSPKREAQAAATREKILEAFVEQLSEPGRSTLSPSEAAARVGVSVRTVHGHFPNLDSQIAGVGEWFDRNIFPRGFEVARDADDLPRYFRDIHRLALESPIARALAYNSRNWPGFRQERRRARLDAIRRALKELGAPKKATENATAVLLALSGADASWSMHDLYGLPLDRIPDAIAHTVQLVVNDLRSAASRRS
jgi:AcrR family transcriptional regulator